MAGSPSHKFGQDLGNLLEYVVLYLILKPRLEEFTAKNKYFLLVYLLNHTITIVIVFLMLMYLYQKQTKLPSHYHQNKDFGH